MKTQKYTGIWLLLMLFLAAIMAVETFGLGQPNSASWLKYKCILWLLTTPCYAVLAIKAVQASNSTLAKFWVLYFAAALLAAIGMIPRLNELILVCAGALRAFILIYVPLSFLRQLQDGPLETYDRKD